MKGIKYLIAAVLFVAGISAFAQNIAVKGTVAAGDGEPVAGAYVFVKGSTNGQLTDLDGAFTLSNVPANGTLVVAFMGMKTVEVPAAPTVSVVMESDAEYLKEVVVTAMGISREKKALGYATQAVGNEDLIKGAPTDLASAISGKVSGLNITPSSGMPGASTKITIRGSRSFSGNNTPLYVVDGMPIASTADLSTGSSVTGSDYANRALDIDPNDIESVHILKGQAPSPL